ncbi:hypothetical protein PRZ48_012058 [Zasmidium cellare]|uniref:RING-type domain-containing protein n=1 Tax=Zasmidium cellare TaxID=395010 RepID=A0ABR0E428_ZASCE|nr:hypothetical protein PRZ48_012058 [Zasmidium cellare]
MSLPTRSQYLFSLTAAPLPLPADWSCRICMETTSADAVASHGTQHIYCRACLAPWLVQNNTCPTCREVLFRPIPARRRLTPEEQRRTDSYQLRQIRGHDHYLELIESRLTTPPGLVRHYLEETVKRLNHRWEMYRAGTLQRDLSYHTPISQSQSRILHRSGPSTPQPDDSDSEMDVDEETTPLNAHSLITAFFAEWWTVFSSARTGSTIHHPLATALLNATVDALQRWDGWQLTPTNLDAMLRIRLKSVFDENFPRQEFQRPQSWVSHRTGVLEDVVDLFQLGDERDGLSRVQKRALRFEAQHEELWRRN